jgi:hypothetical protein
MVKQLLTVRSGMKRGRRRIELSLGILRGNNHINTVTDTSTSTSR